MCREKGAVRHDDRLDCLSQGVQYFTDALAISAQQAIIDRKRNEWQDMEEAWLENPQAAANHMAFGMSLSQRQKSRLLKKDKQVHNWV